MHVFRGSTQGSSYARRQFQPSLTLSRGSSRTHGIMVFSHETHVKYIYRSNQEAQRILNAVVSFIEFKGSSSCYQWIQQASLYWSPVSLSNIKYYKNICFNISYNQYNLTVILLMYILYLGSLSDTNHICRKVHKLLMLMQIKIMQDLSSINILDNTYLLEITMLHLQVLKTQISR